MQAERERPNYKGGRGDGLYTEQVVRVKGSVNKMCHESDAAHRTCGVEAEIWTKAAANEISLYSQESEAVDRNKCAVEPGRAAVEASKNISRGCMKTSFERGTTMTPESNSVLERPEHWSDCFYGDQSQIER